MPPKDVKPVLKPKCYLTNMLKIRFGPKSIKCQTNMKANDSSSVKIH